ncbi:helix-turn-helix domain-containing protein [Noviherbaspirillum galbum]|uniref:Helix-turn-helix domain-containing protein n=1 Tax=Noviherbaspirillum galbum TaxID=2709383 RepID=A0A6B3SKW2_9BURK|nr:helix-turn-helix domain-containing protein [Noviherbaspirillum galbum]NEX59995.1 helix-turn-helix domain-containing protein [Noviherbaspirillum galbum]
MNRARSIPVYQLYGEHESWLTPDMVHCESIADRSRLHDWHIKPHEHVNLFQVLYLRSGRAIVQLDDERRNVSGPHLLLVPAGCIHGFHFDDDAQGTVVTLAHAFAARLNKVADGGMLRLTRPVLHPVGGEEEDRQLQTMIDAIHREYRDHAPYRNELLESLLAALLIWLSRIAAACHATEELNRGARHFKGFCELVDRWYDRHFHIDHYAKEIGITSAHLNHLCRQASGKSALELIHERLLLEVKRNLVYTSMSISEVSYATGFADPAYFTRFFRRLTGMSPRDFRERARDLQHDLPPQD